MPRSDLLAAPAVVLLLASAACHRPPAVAHVLQPVPVTLEESVAELSPQETAALAPRAARIAVMPDSVTIAPGESYSYAQLRVVVLDSSGSALGRLRVYDASLDPGAAALAGGRQVRGVYPGRSDLWIRFPQALWSGGGSSLPAVPVHIVVRATAAGEARVPSPNDR
jgi:hypothetical protein